MLAGRAYLPFLEAGAVDVAIVDCLWNGVGESVKIAALCDLFEVNCAAHNYRASPAPTRRRPDSAALLCSALSTLLVLDLSAVSVALPLLP